MSPAPAADWPELPYAAWSDTRDTLHLWTQIVGKIRLSQTPWLNHSWHVALYLTARGLTTSLIPHPDRAFEIDFDFVDHALWVRTIDGGERRISLAPMTVAQFYAAVFAAMAELGIDVRITTTPCEIVDPIAFDQDERHAAYDRDAVHRFWRVLASTHAVLARFRTGFLGKASPVHFFWGSFDLAVTRFSGRPAPRHPGGVPHLPDAVAAEAYSHEVSSAGFWPGGADRSITPPSILTPIRRPRVSPKRRCGRLRRSSQRTWASSCSPTTLCGALRTRAARLWTSCNRLTMRRLGLDNGIAPPWTVHWASPDDHGPGADPRPRSPHLGLPRGFRTSIASTQPNSLGTLGVAPR